jgi:stalled ribosome rescue protein Dom34
MSSVEHHLGHHDFAVSTVHAGARRDKDAPDRLREAASEAAQTERVQRRDEQVGKLRQELGEHDLALVGHDKTIEAINEGSVETLFLDAGKIKEIGDSDAIAKDALLFGGDVVIAPDLPTDDGVAALLRYKPT